MLINNYDIVSQQEHVLAELQDYATQSPPPADALSVMKTVAYLKACNQLFERGILGKGVFIKSLSNPILMNMDEGFMYFSKWLDYELSRGIYLNEDIVTFHMFMHSCTCVYYINSRIPHHTNIKPIISLMADMGSTSCDVLWFQRIL